MTALTLDSLLDAGEHHARVCLLELKQTGLAPFYHLVTDDPEHPDAIIPCEFQSDQDKDFAVALATSVAYNIRAKLAMFVSEAWVATYPADTDLAQVTPPSQHADRIEIVALIASDGREHRYRTLAIVRNKRGRITGLTRRDAPSDVALGGRMIDGVIANTATTH